MDQRERVAYWLDHEVLIEADLAERMAAYGGDATEDQFKAQRAQKLIKRLFRDLREFFVFGGVTEAGKVPVDECVAYRKSLLLLNSVHCAVWVLLEQPFCVNCISQLPDKLPNLIVRLSELLVGIKLVSFDAPYESFDLVEPLRGAEAAVRDYLAQLVL